MGTVRLSMPQGLICSRKVAISEITIISRGSMPREFVEEIIMVNIATTAPIVKVPISDFVCPSIDHFGELIDLPIKPANPSPKAMDNIPIDIDAS
tara:strand:- start:67 stop:351 length:285 start_codon:yes stop_codon:yes gene_type:complete